MRNWSIDTSKFDKNSSEYTIWKLEQMINYGLQGEILDTQELQMYLPVLSIDPFKKKFLHYLLKNA